MNAFCTTGEPGPIEFGRVFSCHDDVLYLYITASGFLLGFVFLVMSCLMHYYDYNYFGSSFFFFAVRDCISSFCCFPPYCYFSPYCYLSYVTCLPPPLSAGS